MSRGVASHTQAREVVYFDVSHFDEHHDWLNFEYNLRDLIKLRYPSFENCDTWDDREVHEILSNNFCVIAVSEYFGVASVSVADNVTAYENNTDGIARTWLRQNAHSIAELIEQNSNLKALRRIGAFSNGETVYEAIPAKA